jgi:hypothetical protein
MVVHPTCTMVVHPCTMVVHPYPARRSSDTFAHISAPLGST